MFAILDRYTYTEPGESDGIKPDILTGHVVIYDVHFAYHAQPDIKISKKKHEREQTLKQRFEQSMKEAVDKSQGLNLYIKNLDDTVDDEGLKELFSSYGIITSRKVCGFESILLYLNFRLWNWLH